MESFNTVVVYFYCSIGYPVVTFGFACKTYITCVIQQVIVCVV